MVLSISEELRILKLMYCLRNQTILKVSGEGCQGRSEFEWIGKVIKTYYNKDQKWHEVLIQIMKHNHSYCDVRDEKQPEYYSYPLVNRDIQNVNGVWILFT